MVLREFLSRYHKSSFKGSFGSSFKGSLGVPFRVL